MSETMLFNGIFVLTCYPVLFFVYFIFRKAKDRNHWCFGATLSKEQKNSPAVAEIDNEYQEKLKKMLLVGMFVPVLGFFTKHFSISFTIWMIWLLLICFLPMIFYAKANHQVMELKAEQGWGQEFSVSYADLKKATAPRRVRFVDFLPAILLSLIPIGLAYVLFPEAGYVALRGCTIEIALCTVLLYLCAVWTDRLKITVISDDSDTNTNFARAKKQIWRNYWLVCVWINTVFVWLILLGMYIRNASMMLILIGSAFYGVVIMLLTIRMVKQIADLNVKYENRRTLMDASDDDRYWIWGIMYYNKNDSHFMVENRMGTGTACNMAKPAAKVLYIFASLCLLLIPILCVWMILLDFTPIQTTVTDGVIRCQHVSVEYEIPMEDIESYEILKTLPPMMKINGNGMEHVLSGRYEIYHEGSFETFLNPQNNLFVKIVTDDEMYYISGVDDAQTQEIISQLQ